METQDRSTLGDQIRDAQEDTQDVRRSAAPTRAPETPKGIQVGDIVEGGVDSRGARIDHVYFKRQNYAVYSCGGKIFVFYADDEEIATKQIADTAPLIPLREKLQFLVAEQQHDTCYLPQIAEAFRLGLEEKEVIAKETLEGAIQNALGNQAREGRLQYLAFAVPLGLAVAAVLIWLGVAIRADPALNLLLQAAGGGAVGSVLSIIIAIRSRTVAVDGDWRSNVLDACGRLLIGVISAAVLFLILTAGIIAQVKAGEATLVGKDATWEVALIIGFAAGFFERLVPDLLAKSLDEQQTSSTSTPAG